jgi:hypothetical protein
VEENAAGAREEDKIKYVFLKLSNDPPLTGDVDSEGYKLVCFLREWSQQFRNKKGDMRNHTKAEHSLGEDEFPVAFAKTRKDRGAPKKKNGKVDTAALKRANRLSLKKKKEKAGNTEGNQKPKPKPTPKAAPTQRRLFAFMYKLLYDQYTPPLEDDDSAEPDIERLFIPLLGTHQAREDTQDVSTMLDHLRMCKLLLDELHIPDELTAFAREAVRQEGENPNLLVTDEHFERRVRWAARRVVTCIRAARTHLTRLTEAYTNLADQNRARAHHSFFVGQPIADFDSDTVFMRAMDSDDFEYTFNGDYPFRTVVGDAILFLADQAITMAPGHYDVEFWAHY